MIQNIKIDDFLDYKESFITYNKIIIYKRDILRIPKLLDFFNDNGLYIENEFILADYQKSVQNKIGLIYLDYYGYITIYQDNKFLNYSMLYDLFEGSEKLLSILNISRYNTNLDDLSKLSDEASEEEKETILNRNNISILKLSENDFNLIILNFFSKNYRNSEITNVYVPPTEYFFDVDMSGKYKKITKVREFILDAFGNYLKISPGEIPFSNNFGSRIKEIIHMKYTNKTIKFLNDEITIFFNSIKNNFNIDMQIVDILQMQDSTGLYDKIRISIIISVEKEILKIELIK